MKLPEVPLFGSEIHEFTRNACSFGSKIHEITRSSCTFGSEAHGMTRNSCNSIVFLAEGTMGFEWRSSSASLAEALLRENWQKNWSGPGSAKLRIESHHRINLNSSFRNDFLR